jgi:hypothetical protein
MPASGWLSVSSADELGVDAVQDAGPEQHLTGRSRLSVEYLLYQIAGDGGFSGLQFLRELVRVVVSNSSAMSGAARNPEAEPRDLAIDSDLEGRMVPLSYYEIRVAGVLPFEVLLDFDRLTAPVEPVVHGPLQDQAAPRGLLTRLETFAVQVIEVRRLHDTAVSPDCERRRA